MSGVIIRLQNLPWAANALDIRQYFQGLSIPDGGVHIVGGEDGDAFIAFSTDEDARQAFIKNHGAIKDVQISLLLSSRTEMQKVIEAARNKTMAAFMGNMSNQQIMPSVVPSSVPTENKKDDKEKRDRRRSRSRSRERKLVSYDRKRDRRRERSRSRSRDRNSRDGRDRRRRDRSRSRERSKSRERKNRRANDKNMSSNTNAKEPRVGVWEAPPTNNQSSTVTAPVDSANVLANFVANNILPNIVSRNFDNSAFQNRWENPNTNNFQNQQSSAANNYNSFNPRNAKNQHNNSNYNNNNGQNQKNDNETKLGQSNCCIQLNPFYGGFGGIRRFFNGLFIQNDGIKFINDEYGKRTGTVYVKFAYPDGKDEALGRNGDQIRNNTIIVEHLDDEEFANAVDRYQPDQPDQPDNNYDSDKCGSEETCIVIKSLPAHATTDEIYDIFSNYSISSVFFDNKFPNKSAYVQFNTNEDAMNALDDINSHVYDGYPLKVESCLQETFDKIKLETNKDINKDSAPSETIIMSGLPMKCSDRDIVDFFSDIGVMPAKINLTNNENGSTGEACCEFYNMDDAILAFQKNGMPFGNETVSMVYKQSPMMPPQMPMQPQRMPTPMMNPNMNMQPMNRPPFFPRGNFMGPRGPPRGPPMMGMMGPRGMMGGPRRFLPPPPPHMQPPNRDDNEDLAPRGCILLMENVPYKAGLDEILEFLEGFNVPRENVLRKYNPNGLPSGETKVIFNTPDEVFHVIQGKRGARIRDRLVYMTQI